MKKYQRAEVTIIYPESEQSESWFNIERFTCSITDIQNRISEFCYNGHSVLYPGKYTIIVDPLPHDRDDAGSIPICFWVIALRLEDNATGELTGFEKAKLYDNIVSTFYNTLLEKAL